jgi:hypothetical protein
MLGPDNIDDIHKEKNILKQKQEKIQSSIQKSINITNTKIQDYKNKIQILQGKKKELIIEYNKECSYEDRIRGATPPKIDKSNIINKSDIINVSRLSTSPTTRMSTSPTTRLFNKNMKEINSIKKELNNDKFLKMMESIIDKKINVLEDKIDKQEKKIEDTSNNSSICEIM